MIGKDYKGRTIRMQVVMTCYAAADEIDRQAFREEATKIEISRGFSSRDLCTFVHIHLDSEFY